MFYLHMGQGFCTFFEQRKQKRLFNFIKSYKTSELPYLQYAQKAS